MNIEDLLKSTNQSDIILGIITMTPEYWEKISIPNNEPDIGDFYDKIFKIGGDRSEFPVVIINGRVYEIARDYILSIKREKQEEYIKWNDVLDSIIYNDNSI